MADEREDRYEGEEDEYHFSDEQMNYDVEGEAHKMTESPIPEKESLFTKFSKITPRRRAMITGVVFIVLIGLVYKMLSPSSSDIPTEFASPSTAQQQAAPAQPAKPTPPPPTVVVEQPPAVAPAPVATTQPTPSPQPSQPEQVAETKQLIEKLAFLEQQNAAIMNLLQTEYAQKMSDFEMQSSLARGKMDEMSKRVNRIEGTLNQVTQMLQEGAAKPQAHMKADTKMIYSVQAIIPGRAWLKSDAGDTVTVAEGDILKNYGRIARIDPYDGIVQIDTGNKMITLSYGISVQ